MARTLDLALRENQGRNKMAAFLEDLSRRLGRAARTIEVVPLQESDAAFEIYGKARTKAETENGPGRLSAAVSRPEDLRGALSKLRDSMPESALMLFRSESRWCGAVRTTTSEVLSRLEALLVKNQEDVLAATPDGEIGLFCSWDADGEQDRLLLLAWH
jgi:hypothetical protein